MNLNRKPLLVIIALWILFIMVPIGILIVHSLQGYHISQEYAVPESFTATAPYGADVVVFSNGQALATYNYTSGQVSALSPAAGLASIDTVSVSANRFIVFHDGQILQAGSLAAQLRSQGADPTFGYWWVYDTQARTFQPLPQNVLIAKPYNGKLYTLEYSNAGESINTYQLPGLQRSATLAVNGSSDFQPTASGYLLESGDNNVLFTSNGAVNQVLLSNATLVGITSDGLSAVAVQNHNSMRSLVVENLQTDTSDTVVSNVSNLPVWLDSGTVLYTDTRGNVFSYTLATKKSTEWKFGGNLAQAKPNLKLTALIDPTTAILNDGTNNYYLIGKGLASTSSVR